jgi:glycosyltransferase involved in cell wall biosynthesis
MDVVLAGLDIIALTSHNEGTPVSLIEAQAAERALVSTNVGGVADVALEGKTGFITPPGEAAPFAAALVKLADDAQLRNTFGIAGRQHVQQLYSYHRLVGDMKVYYNRLLAGKR